ncbi:FtsX-like permease family protein [Nonomuraea indica]|uniref:FtsX-like permease family protein n=1 Tax=Nonomuraea indica TaxID=1581193 RepID=UPI000C7C93A8|nr:FtsX-like permease family protein [Nonomuraea indica]
MSSFRAALRIARRDALRARGRTALIMVMIGLPVLAITALLTLNATTDVTVREGLPAHLGAVAEARVVTHAERTPVRQTMHGDLMEPPDQGDGPPRPWTAGEVGALLGGRVIPHTVGQVEILLQDGYDRVDALGLDLRDPMTRGVRVLAEGRFPASAQEVAVTPALLDRGVRLGDVLRMTRQARPLRVVGVVEHPVRPGIQEIALLPGSVPQDGQNGRGAGWLADTPAPVTSADSRRLNAAGLTVMSRAVLEERTGDRSFWPYNGRGLVELAVGVVLVVTETVLLAGPAFAVGLRRRRRELAMIAVQGGSGAHLRAIVLAEGLVLGGAAAVLGTVLGVGAGPLALSVAARELDWHQGPFEVPWGPVLGVAVLGVLSGLVAAVVPAIQAATQHPALVLADREPGPRRRAGRLLPGLVLLALGLGGLAATLHRSVLAVVTASVLVVFGLVAVTPWLIGVTARFAHRLPLSWRLSVRDAARHRVRTASAVAAVMAATMGAVAVGIGYSSMATAGDAARVVEAPVGSVSISGHGADDQGWARLRTAVERAMPGVPLVPSLEVTDARGAALGMTAFPSPERCRRGCQVVAPDYSLPVGDERLLAFLQGRRDPRAAAALRAGKAVVFDGELVEDGMLNVSVMPWQAGPSGRRVALLRVPAVVAEGAGREQGGALLPASAVRDAGLRLAERRVFARHVPDSTERLERDLRAVHGSASLRLVPESRYDSLTVLSAGLVAALVVVLGGTLAATGLAVADMRRDLDTLSAVGAAPLTRRLVVSVQAGYVAGLGTVVGLAGGIVTGVALTWPLIAVMRPARGGRGLFDPGPTVIDVPWPYVAAIVAGLPVLAALVAGVFTRTRLVVARRLA